MTGQFEQALPLPPRNGNGSGGATFLGSLAPDQLGCSPADPNTDGRLDFGDVSRFIDAVNGDSADADVTSDGVVSFDDVTEFIELFNAGCP